MNFYYDIKRYCIPFNSLMLLVWLRLIWNGSSFDKLFQKRNKALMAALLVLDGSLIAYNICGIELRLNGRRTQNVFVYFALKFADFYCVGIYFYYGHFKRYKRKELKNLTCIDT